MALSLLRDTGTVASMRPKTERFDFTPGDRLEGRIAARFYHLGDITCQVRSGTNNWKTFSTVKSPLGASLTQKASGFSIDLTGTTGEAAPVTILRSWQVENETLVLRINLTNRTEETIEVGALGVAMVFNNDFSKRSLEDTHEYCSFADPYIGGEAGYIQVTRVNGAGPVLLVLPERGTSFEAYRPIRREPVPTGVTHEGKYEWMIHTKAYAETEWPEERQWNKPTSRMLNPGEEAVYGFRFVLAPTIRDIEQTLTANARPVVVAVPGYVLPMDQAGRCFVHSPSEVSSLAVEPATAASITSEDTRLKEGWREYRIRGRHPGTFRLTISYRDGTSQFVHYNVIPSAADQVQRLARFHETKQWFTNQADPFKRGFSWMFWDRQAGMLLQENRAWNVGLSDECGAGPNLLMAVKNLLCPTPEQVRQLEAYVDNALWGNLQSRTNYGIRASLFYYEPGLFPSNYYTVQRGWDKTRSETTWRAYNYPHQAAVYWSLYRLSRFHDGLVTNHDWRWYLEHAFRTGLAMRDHCGTNAFRNLAQFGLMDGTVFIEILQDLRREGWKTEAGEFESYMRSRASVWKAKRYPFGSEMPWDSTGQEEVYGWCKYFGMDEKAKIALDAVVAYTPVVPNWAYNGSSRRYFDSMIYGKYRGVFREGMHYGASLNAIPLLDAFRRSPSDFHLLRAGYAGANGVLANIDAEGHGSMLFSADPSTMDWEPYSGDYGCAFFGHAINAGSYAVEHPLFGWLGFGCDIQSKQGRILITPRDAFRKRLFLANTSAWITLNSGSIDYAELDSRKGTLILSLSPADKHTFTAYFSATRTTDGRHMVPSGAVKQDKGLYAVPLGKGATRLEFNLKHTP